MSDDDKANSHTEIDRLRMKSYAADVTYCEDCAFVGTLVNSMTAMNVGCTDNKRSNLLHRC